MPLASAAAENAAVNAITAISPYASQHTGSTSTTGANEYASTTRVAESWNTGASGVSTNSAGLTFANSGATPVTYLGSWSASTAGTFSIGRALGSSVTAAAITVAAGADSIAAA